MPRKNSWKRQNFREKRWRYRKLFFKIFEFWKQITIISEFSCSYLKKIILKHFFTFRKMVRKTFWLKLSRWFVLIFLKKTWFWKKNVFFFRINGKNSNWILYGNLKSFFYWWNFISRFVEEIENVSRQKSSWKFLKFLKLVPNRFLDENFWMFY